VETDSVIAASSRVKSEIRVLCFTMLRTGPSDRYRIRQLIPYLLDHGIVLEDHCLYEREPVQTRLGKRGIRYRSVAPLLAFSLAWDIQKRFRSLARQKGFDLVWLQRNILPGAEWLMSFIRRPTVLDIDDAVWMEGALAAARFRFLARRAKSIIVGNESLRAWFTKYSDNISTIPTSVDVNRYLRNGAATSQMFRIGWLGTYRNLKYVETIAAPLKAFLHEHSNSEFVIISDHLPTSLLEMLPRDKVRFVPWSEDVEFGIAREFDIGIMPLRDDEWTRGKCAFKLLQYLAAGLPAIASPVGLSAEVIHSSGAGFSAREPQEWFNAFQMLKNNPDLRRSAGDRGRSFIQDNFSTQRIGTKVAEVIKSAANRCAPLK
jgi:glycosyltransferase involved in cell wall biosynthesis